MIEIMSDLFQCVCLSYTPLVVFIYIYIYIKNCCVRLLLNYNIKYICTIYTRSYTCLASIPRFALREKVTLRLLKLLFKGVDVVEWSRVLDVRLSEWCWKKENKTKYHAKIDIFLIDSEQIKYLYLSP
jgi:hypothetical protein